MVIFKKSKEEKVQESEVTIENTNIVRNLEELKELIEFIKKHKIDEVTMNGLSIKNSVHFEPETEDERIKRIKREQAELIGWAAR